MSLTLTKFKRPTRPLKRVPSVSIKENGFGISAAAIGYFGQMTYAELMYGESDGITLIGIKPVADRTQDSYVLRLYREDSPVGVLSARDFIQVNSIMDKVKKIGRRSFYAEVGTDGIILIKLQ